MAFKRKVVSDNGIGLCSCSDDELSFGGSEISFGDSEISFDDAKKENVGDDTSSLIGLPLFGVEGAPDLSCFAKTSPKSNDYIITHSE